jgi:toxin HigB-1
LTPLGASIEISPRAIRRRSTASVNDARARPQNSISAPTLARRLIAKIATVFQAHQRDAKDAAGARRGRQALTDVTRDVANLQVIKSFRHKELGELFATGKSAAIPPELRRKCLNRLTVLNQAASVREVTGVGFVTHPLQGTNPIRYSLSVSEAWRITFEFENGDAYRVDVEQYH